MKTTLRAFALVLGTGCLLPAFSLASGPNGIFSVDGQLSRRVSGVIGHDYGMGGSLSLEFQPVQAFSIGVNADLLDFVGVNTPGQSFLQSINIIGRGIFNGGGTWQPYLMGGYGINPKVETAATYTWWGDYHIMGGLGSWYFFDPHWALDMAVVYNYYEFGADPLNTINVRMGFSYFFAPALDKYSVTSRFPSEAARPKSLSSVPAAQPLAQAPAVKSAIPASGVKTVISTPLTKPAAPASKLQAERHAVGVPISKKEIGAPVSKAKSASAGIPQGSAIGPKGLALFREPAPASALSDRRKSNGPAPGRVEGKKGKVIAEEVEKDLEEEETDEIPVGGPASKTSAKGKEPAKSAAMLKKGMGAAAKAPLGQLAFRESAIQAPAAKAPGSKAAEVSTRKGDSLWDTAARKDVYGDPELYPLLVDANKAVLKPNQLVMEPGTKLAVPQNPAQDMVNQARKNAWAAAYQRFSGRRLTLEGYKKWREKNIPAPVSSLKAPAPRSQTEERVSTSSVALGRDSGQRVGVPISKKEMGTASKTPLGQVAFRESAAQTPALKAKSSSPALVSKTTAKAPAPKSPAKTSLGQVAFRETTSASKPQAGGKKPKGVESEEPETSPEGPSEISTLKGQSLWDAAARKDVYGDPELYPLLLDANRKVIKPDRMALPAGTKLAVPRGVTEAKIQKARINAWTNDYMRYRGMGLSKPAYEKWRKKNMGG